MGRVWIVNPFDPLPGDPEQPGRYASLARMLRDDGHDVTWWSSTFSHRFKQPVNRDAVRHASAHEEIGVRLVDAPAYQTNVGIQRLRSNRALARRFETQARDAARDVATRPDVIISSNPPPDMAAAAARVATACGARLVVDVQDLWIDNWTRMMPAAVRWLSPVLLRPWRRANHTAYAAADAVVGVAMPYAHEADAYRNGALRRDVIPLGIDLAAFDEAADVGTSILGDKPEGEIWTIYSGSFSVSYDVLTVADVARRIVSERDDVRFIFSGRGDLERRVRERAGDHPRVTFLGFAPFADWAATLTQCDVGWNAVKPDNLIYFPNKIFYYWAGGVAVMNSIPGECAEWVERTESGTSYPSGDVNAAHDGFKALINDSKRLFAMRQSARDAAETRWDRATLYVSYLDLVNDLIDAGAPPPTSGVGSR